MTAWIADKSQITRLGIISVLKQLVHPLSIREVSLPDKLWTHGHKISSNILIISASFLSLCAGTVSEKLDMLMFFSARILIRDQEIPALLLAAFDEVIHPDDPEKIILHKINGKVDLVRKTVNPQHDNNEISDREKEVLRLVAMGLTNKEIAEKLFISTHTVITHRKNITAKLGIKTIAGLSVYAVINKLISIEDIH